MRVGAVAETCEVFGVDRDDEVTFSRPDELADPADRVRVVEVDPGPDVAGASVPGGLSQDEPEIEAQLNRRPFWSLIALSPAAGVFLCATVGPMHIGAGGRVEDLAAAHTDDFAVRQM